MTASPLPPVTPGKPLTGWYVEASCPRCGADLAHVADGRPSGTDSRAVARCTGCGREWAVGVRIFPVADVLPSGTRGRRRESTPKPGLNHGTRASYNEGCGCDPCLDADRDYRQARARRAA